MKENVSINRNYKTIIEDRGWYFTEYHPATKHTKFAVLHLTIILENVDKQKITEAMEKELREWLLKYPVPLYVTAWDNAENRYEFKELEKNNSLIGFINESGEFLSYWGIDNNKFQPNFELKQDYLDSLYSKIEYFTDAEHNINKEQRRKQIKLGYMLIIVLPFIWGIIYECILYFNSFIALIAFLYFIFKTSKEAFKLLGVLPKSKKEIQKDKEDTLKNHYYYYCQLNPEGFKKLKLEAIEKMAKERVSNQVKELRK